MDTDVAEHQMPRTFVLTLGVTMSPTMTPMMTSTCELPDIQLFSLSLLSIGFYSN